MKQQAIISLIIGVACTVLASTNVFSKVVEKLQSTYETQYAVYPDMSIHGKGLLPISPGESETLIQGEGDATEFLPKWKINTKADANKTDEQTKTFNISKKIEEEKGKIVVDEETTTELKKGERCMNEILISFWHGAASVLIGELFAILMFLSWSKIHRNNKTIENNEGK